MLKLFLNLPIVLKQISHFQNNSYSRIALYERQFKRINNVKLVIYGNMFENLSG